MSVEPLKMMWLMSFSLTEIVCQPKKSKLSKTNKILDGNLYVVSTVSTMLLGITFCLIHNRVVPQNKMWLTPEFFDGNS